MELLHIDHSMVDLHKGPLVVRHGDTEWEYVLREGQHVVLTDRDGEFHDGTVLWVEDRADLDDGPLYHLHVGVRLPVAEASQRIADVDMTPENRGMHQLLDLLGALAEEDRRHDE